MHGVVDGNLQVKNLKPGDIIEWVHNQDDKPVNEQEELYSTPMNRWVPIGSRLIHTLISIDDEQIAWVNEKGLFHARRNNIGTRCRTGVPGAAHPSKSRL